MIPHITVVKQYERLAVFWLGKFTGLKPPGLKLMFWPFNSYQRIDLREVVIDIPRQTNITLDNAPIDIDFLVYMRVMEASAEKAIIEVVDYRGAVIGIATTTLRAVIGEISLDDVLSQRDRINEQLRQKLDEVTERWGIKVTQVEIREVEPARDIQDAMNRQMSAERFRRAAVTEAEGTREAAVTVAEGEKQASILAGGGRPSGRDTFRRGRPTGSGSARRRLQLSTGQDPRRSPKRRRQHAQPPVLRHPQAVGKQPVHQVHLPDGVHQPAQSVHAHGEWRGRGRK